MVEGLGPVFRGDDRGQFIIADIKFTKKVTVYHVFDSFQFQPLPTEARRNGQIVCQRSARTAVSPLLVRFSTERTSAGLDKAQPEKKKNHPPTQGVGLRKHLL